MAETVRACRPEDLPAVADIFTRVLLKQKRPAGSQLASYLDEVVLGSVPYGGEARSRVFVDAGGDVRGFIGIWRRTMVLKGRSIEAAAAGSLMVDQPQLHPTAGARLLRAFLTGPQDLSFSETANDISQRMWEKAGGERLAASSLDWLRVLRPVGFTASVARNAFRPAVLLRGLASGIDGFIEARGRNSLLPPREANTYRDTDVTADEAAELIRELTGSYALHPDWQSPGLPFLLAHAENKERYGTLYRRAVYGRNGQPSGCYLYYARAGEVARVLQVISLPEAAGITLDSLFRHAADMGCVAVRGRVAPELLDALTARRCVMFPVSAMMVHARDKALLAEVRQSRAMLTGLAGETWTRLIGGEFA